jgi:hypothetical protein
MFNCIFFFILLNIGETMPKAVFHSTQPKVKGEKHKVKNKIQKTLKS